MSRNRPMRAYPPAAHGRAARPAEGEWELCLAGELTDKQTDLLEHITEVPRRSRGVIYFDSCGGSVYVGLSLAALIRLRGLDVTGIVLGECSSAALLPFAACQKRFVTSHSTLLFHPMKWQSEEDVRLEEAAEWTRHFQHLERDLDQLLVQLFDCDEALITEWTRPGHFVTGTEMVDAGLAGILTLFDGDFWQQTRAERG